MQSQDSEKAVRKMQDYIAAHIRQPISMTQLAQAAGYSPWHSAKLFKALTGKAPFDYIRSLRLTKAALTLRDEKQRVIDVALDFVFDSHEGFTKAFSRQFGLPPKRYAALTPPIRYFIPYPVLIRHTHQKGGSKVDIKSNLQAVFVQVIERPARKVLLRRGVKAADYYAYCEEVGCDVWGLLTSVKEALYEPVGMWLPEGMIPPGTSKYVQGVELPLDYHNEVPDGFELVAMEPCKMMVFQGPPYKDDDFEEAITDLWSLIKAYDPSLYGYVWADDEAPRFQLAPMGYRGYIEARPVKSVGV